MFRSEILSNIAIIVVLCPIWGYGNAQQGTSLHSTAPKKETSRLLLRATTAETLESVALETISSDSVLGRKRLLTDPGTKSISIDISPAPLASISFNDPALARLLEQSIRIEAFQRDLKSSSIDGSVWQGSVAQVEVLIGRSLTRLKHATPSNQDTVIPGTDSIELAFQSLRDAIVHYGTSSGWSIEQSRDPATGFTVRVIFSPNTVHVFVMPYTTYLICTKSAIPLQDQWNEIYEGSQRLSGRYHFKAVWPANIHGMIENNFEVSDNNQVLQFSPTE
jgi:hypothetical protein